MIYSSVMWYLIWLVSTIAGIRLHQSGLVRTKTAIISQTIMSVVDGQTRASIFVL